MTHDQALEIHAELTRLAGQAPGPDDDGRMRLRRLVASFEADEIGNSYLREKATDVRSFLGPWLSAGKWEQWGDDPERLRAIISNALYQLKRAIDQHYGRKAPLASG